MWWYKRSDFPTAKNPSSSGRLIFPDEARERMREARYTASNIPPQLPESNSDIFKEYMDSIWDTRTVYTREYISSLLEEEQEKPVKKHKRKTKKKMKKQAKKEKKTKKKLGIIAIDDI